MSAPSSAHRVAGAALGLLAALALQATTAAPPAQAQSACRSVAIRSPVSGEAVTGSVPILGSAAIDAFQFYKVEWAPIGDPESWRAVSDIRREAVINGLLDVWDTSRVPDGLYRLKLTVVDEAAVEMCHAFAEDVVVGGMSTEGTATETATATATASATTVEEAAPTETPLPPDTEPPPAEATAGEAPAAETSADASTEPTATLEPVAVEEDSGEADTELDLEQLVGAFAAGFFLALLAATALLLLQAARGSG
jgi:hypothetical protein